MDTPDTADTPATPDTPATFEYNRATVHKTLMNITECFADFLESLDAVIAEKGSIDRDDLARLRVEVVNPVMNEELAAAESLLDYIDANPHGWDI